MNRNKIKNSVLAASVLTTSLLLSSCDTFLDKYPDSRMELRNPSDVSKLLVTAYPTAHPAYLLEMYSDNTDELNYSSWSAADRFQEQAYYWEDITETHAPETPQNLFDTHYSVVTTVNEALKFMESAPNKDNYQAQIAEAKLCRAYAMFQLANVFCQAYSPETASQDYGMPYPKVVEESPGALVFKRGTLAELYANIEQDIKDGLEGISSAYTQPKLHFTPQSAHAFAARFYLYKKDYEKAIQHADQVLTTSPRNVLRDWAAWARQATTGNIATDFYSQASVAANLLFLDPVTEWGIFSIPTLRGQKYAHGEYLSTTETLSAEGPWGVSNEVLNYKIDNMSTISKYALRKFPYKYQVTDEAAQNGVPYSRYAIFTTDETLLVRAEAKALLGRYDEALADLNLELSAFAKNNIQLTIKKIQDFYKAVKYYTPERPTVKKELHTTPALEAETQEPLIQAILQLRRIITLHEGLRMQDIKRYGITIYRRQIRINSAVTAVTDSMKIRDPRLAIQIPQDVILKDLEPNPRTK